MKKNNVLVIMMFLALSITPIQGFAAEGPPHKMQISRHWARPSLASPNSVSTSAAFMTLQNNQPHDDVLEHASSDVCDTVELHAHIKEGDIMRMRPLKNGIPIAANQSAILEPGGLHVMLIGLKKHLHEGEVVSLKLHFQKAGIVSLSVPVKKQGSQGHHKQSGCGCSKDTPKTQTAQ